MSWYRFAIKNTSWEEYLELDSSQEYDVLMEWYEFALHYLCGDWVLTMQEEYELKYPPLCIIEQIEKPPDEIIKDRIHQHQMCMQNHQENIEDLTDLLGDKNVHSY